LYICHTCYALSGYCHQCRLRRDHLQQRTLVALEELVNHHPDFIVQKICVNG